MKIIYIDEAGCTGALPLGSSKIQPVFCMGGVIIDYKSLGALTQNLLNLKRKFYPNLMSYGPTYLDTILTEVKGAEIRKDARSTNRNTVRHAFGYLDGIANILDIANARIVARVWIKAPDVPINSRAIYTYSVWSICSWYHDYLTRNDDLGMIVADARLKQLNSQVSHSLFTRKFKTSGDIIDRIVELPAFAHSDNHAGLQVCDTLCSAIIWPIAVYTYCTGMIQNAHIHPEYRQIKERYAFRLRGIQHRYQQAGGKWLGGVTVSDAIGARSGAAFFAL